MNTSEIKIPIQSYYYPQIDSIISNPDNICDFVREEDRHHTAIDICDSITKLDLTELKNHGYEIGYNEIKFQRLKTKKVEITHFISVRDMENNQINHFIYEYDFKDNQWHLYAYINEKRMGL